MKIKPCPFCKQKLYVHERKFNPYATCETPGCWMHQSKISIDMDDPKKISLFNFRGDETGPQRILEMITKHEIFFAVIVIVLILLAIAVASDDSDDGPGWL